MEELKSWYREQLLARIEALEAAASAFGEEPSAETAATMRRIAHSLRGSGGTYGFPRITEVAAEVEEAANGTLLPAVEILVETLREVATRGEPDRMRILLIDDDIEITHLLERHLSSRNREILVAHTAAEAERIVEVQDVSLVVLDLLLPDTDGRNLLVELRERAATANVPVIVLTTKAGPLTRSECFALGADEFFEKPFDVDAFAAAVASKLQRTAELADDSRRDLLTGLPNRAGFHDAFRRAAAYARRHRTDLAIGFIDLDRFKRVNDSYGHRVGDEVLRRVADLLAEGLRESDIVARWGGEEFVALFPDTDVGGAVQALEKVRERFAAERFRFDEEALGVTFSAGVAPVGDHDSIEEAVARADYYLYLAKSAGRDRVTSESADVPRPKRKVLIAEDDELVATLIRHRLVQEGFEVARYDDGESALRAIESSDGADPGFSLVILDVLLPGVDGFTLLDRLRSKRSFAHVPVIVLTVMGSEEDVVRGLSLGADDYVVKPFSPTELLARIHRLLERA